MFTHKLASLFFAFVIAFTTLGAVMPSDMALARSYDDTEDSARSEDDAVAQAQMFFSPYLTVSGSCAEPVRTAYRDTVTIFIAEAELYFGDEFVDRGIISGGLGIRMGTRAIVPYHVIDLLLRERLVLGRIYISDAEIGLEWTPEFEVLFEEQEGSPEYFRKLPLRVSAFDDELWDKLLQDAAEVIEIVLYITPRVQVFQGDSLADVAFLPLYLNKPEDLAVVELLYAPRLEQQPRVLSSFALERGHPMCFGRLEFQKNEDDTVSYAVHLKEGWHWELAGRYFYDYDLPWFYMAHMGGIGGGPGSSGSPTFAVVPIADGSGSYVALVGMPARITLIGHPDGEWFLINTDIAAAVELVETESGLALSQ